MILWDTALLSFLLIPLAIGRRPIELTHSTMIYHLTLSPARGDEAKIE
jgi:hypothetical protein